MSLYTDVYAQILPVVQELGKKSITLTRSLASLGWKQVRDTVTKAMVWVNADGTVQSTEPSVKSYTGYGVQSSYEQYYGPDVTIKAGDLRIYTMELPAPKPGDTMTVDGNELLVVSVKPIAPGDVVLMYDVQLRKA